jgi:uncharacterized protein
VELLVNLLAKVHVSQNNKKVIAICDPDLIGKIIEEGNKQIDLSGEFYNGALMPEDEILMLVKQAYIVNLVGEMSVTFGLRNSIIKETNIIKIKNVPIAQIIIYSD